ncbi:MAG: Bug family tripartite tricarboxylate transporter substrate binding protein [Polaromonas sp.]
MNRYTFLTAAILGVTLPFASMHAHAQGSHSDYPTKPIRMIVPFAPGGASDFVARAIAPRLSQILGQALVIDNKSGVAGNLGMEAAAGAAPDGYTVFLGNVGTLAINPAIFGKQQRVTAADFEPVSLVANAPDILVASITMPVKTVRELIDYGHRNPKEMSFASPGSGSLNRLEMELFRGVAQIEMVHVPYKGGAGAAIVDVVGGQVPIMFTPIPAALQLIRAGRLTPLAIASKERQPFLPNVPTMIESGFPQVVGGSWQALMFPAKTPKPIIAQWHKAILKVVAEEEMKQRLLQGGVEGVTSRSPEELKTFISQEALRWGAVAKKANATSD